jgi:hypothetical protein
VGNFDRFGQRRALQMLKRQAGVVVIAATRADQQAPEYRVLGHGLLTHVLIEGLQPGDDGGLLADKFPADGRVTARELQKFVKVTVPELARELGERVGESSGRKGEYAGNVPITPVGLALGTNFPIGLGRTDDRG